MRGVPSDAIRDMVILLYSLDEKKNLKISTNGLLIFRNDYQNQKLS